MPGVRQTLNISQKVGLAVTVEARVVNANTGLTTVPANTVRRVTSITMLLDAVGADATTACAILRGGTFIPIASFVAVGPQSVFSGELLLQAGDIITNVGDAGATNSTTDMTATFQDYPV